MAKKYTQETNETTLQILLLGIPKLCCVFDQNTGPKLGFGRKSN